MATIVQFVNASTQCPTLLQDAESQTEEQNGVPYQGGLLKGSPWIGLRDENV